MDRKLGMEIHTADLLWKRHCDALEEIKRNEALTGTHGRVLGYLHRREGEDIYQKDIERVFSIRRSTASQMLQLMEKNGLIERKGVDKDARLKKIMMTEKGKQINCEAVAALQRLDKMALAGIETQKLQTFFEVLDEIKRNLGCDECSKDSK